MSTLHRDVVCDRCLTNGISGTRYKCAVCEDYDLCERCFTSYSTFHEADHTFWVYHRPGERERRQVGGRPTLVHDSVMCDVCADRTQPIIGPRYSCKTCNMEYDLCSTHYQELSSHHDVSHTFCIFDRSTTMSEDIPNKYHTGIFCDLCLVESGSQDPICGKRYRCKNCVDCDLCERHFLEEGGTSHADGTHQFIKYFKPGVYEFFPKFPVFGFGWILRFVQSSDVIRNILRVSKALKTYVEGVDPQCCENVMFRMGDLAGLKMPYAKTLRSVPYVGRLRICATDPSGTVCRNLRDTMISAKTFPNLRFLMIDGSQSCRITDRVLRSFPKLTKLVLKCVPAFGSSGFLFVSNTLEGLMIDDSHGDASSTLRPTVLANVPKLRKLQIQSIQFAGEVAEWRHLSQLEKLALWDCSVSDDILRHVGNTLIDLEVRRCHSFGPNGLRHVNRDVEKVTIIECQQLTSRAQVTRALSRVPTKLNFQPGQAPIPPPPDPIVDIHPWVNPAGGMRPPPDFRPPRRPQGKIRVRPPHPRPPGQVAVRPPRRLRGSVAVRPPRPNRGGMRRRDPVIPQCERLPGKKG